MAIAPGELDFISNFNTVWAVVLGAVLATVGGFAATQMERMVGQRERERNSALLFGEVLSTLAIILEIGAETRMRGDPYGAITMRMLRSARREIDIYERNRERLFDLGDGALRARIHTHMVRLSMPLDNIFAATQELAEARLAASAPNADPAKSAAIVARIEEHRDSEFDYLIVMAAKLTSIITQLEPLARHSFQGLGEIARTA